MEAKQISNYCEIRRKKEQRPANNCFAVWRVNSSVETFVLGLNFELRMKFCGKIQPHRSATKSWLQSMCS